MSRGLGKVERALVDVIRHEARPMSYTDIAEAFMQAAGINDFTERRLKPSTERTYRHALHNLVKREILLELAGDKRGKQYFFHPRVLPGLKNGDWGAAVALAIATIRGMKPGKIPASADVKIITLQILKAAIEELLEL